MISVQDFAAKIKAKYPQYKNVDDTTLTQKIIEKYPVYKGQVDLSTGGDKQTGLASLMGNLAEKSVGATPTAQDTTVPAPKMMVQDQQGNKLAAKSQLTDVGKAQVESSLNKNNIVPGSQLPKPWESGAAESFMKSPVGSFLQAQAPQLQEAMNKEANIGIGERLWNVGKQAVEGAGNIGGGVLNVVGGAASQLNPFDHRTVTQKTDQAIGGLNQAVTGAGQLVSSPVAASPVLSKGLSLPIEGLHSTITNALAQTGIDPNSDHGKVIADSWLNGILMAAMGPKKIAEGVTGGLDLAKSTVENIKNVPEAVQNAKENLMNPQRRQEFYKQNIDKSVGQIVQGKTKDIASAKNTLGEIDTTGVKTYSDLSNTIQDKIKALSDAVDQHLNQFPEKQSLSKFDKTVKAGQQSITTNSVSDALNQLQELYDKTSDPANAVRIRDIIERSKTEGLTLKEVNDISREYGTEFGSKAFSKTGEPLTSVNSRAYENTRSGVKQAVRSQLPTKEAQIMDGKMHDLIDTQKLVDNMKEKVNKLSQKIQQRGLGEKVGRVVGETINTLSGGAVKGLIEKFLSRGTGLKTLNALDLQSFLSKNLKNIDRWSSLIDSNPEKFIKDSQKAAPLQTVAQKGQKLIESTAKAAPYSRKE